jgi:PAS domain S-box-containing protein
MTKTQAENNAVHRLVRTNYAIRTGAFAWCFCVLGLHGWQIGLGGTFWLLLTLQFLVYPHFVYYRARYADSPKRAEILNLYFDAGLLGMWVAGMGFPTWIVYAALHATSLNAIVLRGFKGVGTSIAAFCFGAAFLYAGREIPYAPYTGELVTGLCFFGSVIYTCAIGYVEFVQNRRLVAAREALRQGETRYRMITENAADLVAMVDPESRCLYASPSYERILGRIDLWAGNDAFVRAHPDDVEAARTAVRRVAISGRPRELLLRVADRDGRIRQFKTRVQPVEPDAKPEEGSKHGPIFTRLLLVSTDVTDLKESEERLLVAAHALEGMTEAILITDAKGAVLTVNHAFTQLTGFEKDEVVGRPERDLRNGLQSADFYDKVMMEVVRSGYWTGTAWAKRKNGVVYREWRSVRAVKDANGAVSHYVMVFFEVEAPRQNGTATNGPSPSSA